MKAEALNEFIKAMTDILRSAKDFALEQAPDVMREIVAYGFWCSLIAVICGAVLFFGGGWAVKKSLFLAGVEVSDAAGVYGVAGSISMFIGIIVFAANVGAFIQVAVAPKIYLIEYFVGLKCGAGR